MNRPTRSSGLGLALMSMFSCVVAQGAELSMNWQGHDADGVREIELAVGEQAVIEYRISLVAGDTLSGVFFTNESQDMLSQVATTAAPSGWDVGSVDGLFSDIGQQFAVAATAMDEVLGGAGEVLIGTQTIELVGGDEGDQIEVVFVTALLGVLNGSGGFYALTASGTQFADITGFVHLGVGSPGYTRNMVMDVREPLIITVASSGGGGGGGGGPVDNGNDNGTVNDNVNTNDNGATNSNDNGVDNTNTNDNQNVNDNSTDNTNDNSAGNDNGNTNVNANDNAANGNTNTNDNGNDNSDGNDQPRGLCGFGMVSMLPLNLLGLWALRRRRRYTI